MSTIFVALVRLPFEAVGMMVKFTGFELTESDREFETPTIQEINRLLRLHFKNTLYYYGSGQGCAYIHGTWRLDGMTPVGHDYVLDALKSKGEDITKFKAYFENLEALHAEAELKKLIPMLKRQLSEALSRLSVHVHPNDTLTADFIRESQNLLKRT